MRMIEQRPDLFAAFVGTGQIVGMFATQEALYQYALNHATAAHDEENAGRAKEARPSAVQHSGTLRTISRLLPESLLAARRRCGDQSHERCTGLHSELVDCREDVRVVQGVANGKKNSTRY